MNENKIYWRPVTSCCWHAFFIKNDKIVSLCRMSKTKPDASDKVARPPLFFRCAACNYAERDGRNRNLPPTRDWENLGK